MSMVSAEEVAASNSATAHRRSDWLLAEILIAGWGVSALIAVGWVAWMYS